ncbi:M23 family metallopeptidase [Skermania sp. ID1734]|uniref:M23 family metallopeptidase n=1 Tax=Skermania sp. ID1734 TaxID=2597516 RepID=UPI0021032426|nr:M23 family metallopeptidase [Skermania sp. ID1734]
MAENRASFSGHPEVSRRPRHDDVFDLSAEYRLDPLAYSYPPADSVNQAAVRRRGGAHRLPVPPNAVKGRAAVVAVAAGAVVAAGQAALDTNSNHSDEATAITLAGAQVPAVGPATTAEPQAAQFLGTPAGFVDQTSTDASTAPQVLNVAQPVTLGEFSNLLSKGQKYVQERAAAEAAKLRPLFVKFTQGTFTSGFGTRWGALHGGVDVAGPIGTPILAVADGEVISAGPASGFGMWVRLKHADGTVTVYGHIEQALVHVGQHVMAGDEIALMGNRGFSTGPHCHFEVWLNGKDRIDPLPWLASRGISLGPERD